MEKQIYFHVGLPKTGTTSIQGFLEMHRHTLAEAGLLFPIEAAFRDPSGFGIGRNQGPHADMVRHFYDIPTDLKPSGHDWGTLFDGFRTHSSADRLLISAEAQSTAVEHIREEAFRAAIGASRAQFILYLREPVAWLNSLFAQVVMSVRPFDGDIRSFFHTQLYLRIGFAGIAERFARVGPVVVRDFDAVRKDVGLLPDFLSIVGAECFAEAGQTFGRQNVKAFTGEQIAVFALLKRSGTGAAELADLRDAFIGWNAKSGARTGAMMLPRDLVRKVRAKWEADRRQLASRFGLATDPPAPVDAPHRPYRLTRRGFRRVRDQVAEELSNATRDALDRARSELPIF